MAKLKDFKAIKNKWFKDPKVKEEYNLLKEEFQIAEEIIKARTKAHISQSELANMIGTKAPAISRIESPGYGRVSITMLKKVADALNCKLQIKLVPKTR